MQFVELLPSHDAEVLVEQRSVQPLDEAVGLGPSDLSGAVLDLLELEEQLKGMTVGPSAIFPPVVAEHGGHTRFVCLKGGQHVVVHQMHGGDRQLVRVQTSPGIACVAVDGGL